MTNHKKTTLARFRRQLLDAAATCRLSVKVRELPSGVDCPEALDGPHPSKSLLATIVVSDQRSSR